MNEQQRSDVFEAQVINVRDLMRAWDHENRYLNDLIRVGDAVGIAITTKVLGVLYCALAEAIFSRVIHLPGGLNLTELAEVKNVLKNDGVKPAWKRCIQLASAHLVNTAPTTLAPILSTIDGLVEKWIVDPSILRNRLAHGQWTIALNAKNTAVSADLTQQLATLDCVELARREEALSTLSKIVEDMVMSPHNALSRDFGKHITGLIAKLNKMSNWTFAEKMARLKRKPKKKPSI